MSGFRSEKGKIANKQFYTDLSMSQYPGIIDTRDNNINLRGFVNVNDVGGKPDYVMAEYVNALSDSVMSIERALGALPMVPYGTAAGQIAQVVQNGTVGTRLERIENGTLFDERYGGTGWLYNATRPTLNNHKHTGANGQPPKISLKNEVTDILPKANVDLTQTTGITGSDLVMAKNDATLLSNAIADKLSKTTGGEINGNVTINARTHTMTSKEYTVDDFETSSLITLVNDTNTMSRKAKKTDGLAQVYILNQALPNLQYGRYALGVRVKCSSISDMNVIHLQAGKNNVVFQGKDFDKANTWKMFYLIFDYEGSTNIQIRKLSTGGTNMAVSIDHAYIVPAHPGVFEK